MKMSKEQHQEYEHLNPRDKILWFYEWKYKSNNKAYLETLLWILETKTFTDQQQEADRQEQLQVVKELLGDKVPQ